jgi:hypothetical protein
VQLNGPRGIGDRRHATRGPVTLRRPHVLCPVSEAVGLLGRQV